MKIQVVLDNHSAHTSQETRAYLATKPKRFEFVFPPVHASWLNRVKMFFAKLAKQDLRGDPRGRGGGTGNPPPAIPRRGEHGPGFFSLAVALGISESHTDQNGRQVGMALLAVRRRWRARHAAAWRPRRPGEPEHRQPRRRYRKGGQHD